MRARARVDDWSEAALKVLNPPPTGLTLVPAPFSIERKSADAVAALDDLVEVVAAYGFEYRMAAEATVNTSRKTLLALSIGVAVVGLILAIAFSHSMSKPILASLQFAERIAAGTLTNRIEIRRGDELGRLQHALVAMQSSLKTRADEDRDVMDRMQFLAHYDQLTGLCNRAQFTLALDDVILQLDRQNKNFSVLVLDLDSS